MATDQSVPVIPRTAQYLPLRHDTNVMPPPQAPPVNTTSTSEGSGLYIMIAILIVLIIIVIVWLIVLRQPETKGEEDLRETVKPRRQPPPQPQPQPPQQVYQQNPPIVQQRGPPPPVQMQRRPPQQAPQETAVSIDRVSEEELDNTLDALNTSKKTAQTTASPIKSISENELIAIDKTHPQYKETSNMTVTVTNEKQPVSSHEGMPSRSVTPDPKLSNLVTGPTE